MVSFTAIYGQLCGYVRLCSPLLPVTTEPFDGEKAVADIIKKGRFRHERERFRHERERFRHERERFRHERERLRHEEGRGHSTFPRPEKNL